jgi:hypothetical protein
MNNEPQTSFRVLRDHPDLLQNRSRTESFELNIRVISHIELDRKSHSCGTLELLNLPRLVIFLASKGRTELL